MGCGFGDLAVDFSCYSAAGDSSVLIRVMIGVMDVFGDDFKSSVEDGLYPIVMMI